MHFTKQMQSARMRFSEEWGFVENIQRNAVFQRVLHKYLQTVCLEMLTKGSMKGNMKSGFKDNHSGITYVKHFLFRGTSWQTMLVLCQCVNVFVFFKRQNVQVDTLENQVLAHGRPSSCPLIILSPSPKFNTGCRKSNSFFIA